MHLIRRHWEWHGLSSGLPGHQPGPYLPPTGNHQYIWIEGSGLVKRVAWDPASYQDGKQCGAVTGPLAGGERRAGQAVDHLASTNRISACEMPIRPARQLGAIQGRAACWVPRGHDRGYGPTLTAHGARGGGHPGRISPTRLAVLVSTTYAPAGKRSARGAALMTVPGGADVTRISTCQQRRMSDHHSQGSHAGIPQV